MTAKSAAVAPADVPVATKLEALLTLQRLDSQLDEIRRVRGDLPEEVQDLEDEIAGYEVRVKKFDDDIQGLNDFIKSRKQASKEAENLIKKYDEQQQNVRNNREYEAIGKEMELQRLEIQISDKKIKEAQYQIDVKNAEISGTKTRLEERRKDLDNKKGELDTIVAENEEEETRLGAGARRGHHARRKPLAHCLPPHPGQRSQRLGRGAGAPRCLRRLLQHGSTPTAGRHHFAQENHRLRTLWPHSG